MSYIIITSKSVQKQLDNLPGDMSDQRHLKRVKDQIRPYFVE